MEKALTVADWIERLGAQFAGAGLHFGHGTDNARDEAAWLVLHVVGAPLDGSFGDWGRLVGPGEAAELQGLADARCSSGEPLAYLLGRARFAGLEFEVTPDVLVPRSPIAELILDGFRPWCDLGSLRDRPPRVLDMCTGCGCIAIATAHCLPQAQVDAVDISPKALAVAARNVQRHGVAERVRLIHSDLFRSLPPCRYDLILANPPYLPLGELPELPTEYHSEPVLGLASGVDGLDAALEILARAPDYLADDGILVCEVGESEGRMAAAVPSLPFVWLEFVHGGSGMFLLERGDLAVARPVLDALIGERKHVA